MGSISIAQLLWRFSLFLLINQCGKVVSLIHCEEFNNHSSIQGNLLSSDTKLGFESELEQLFDAFNEHDPSKLEEALKLLHGVKINESSWFSHHKNHTRTIPDKIRDDGYPCEVHSVTTSDGYILELYRIPSSPKSANTNETKPAILLMHALAESASGFVVLGPDHSLAYLLADAGYDVWLGNARGTDPSMRHVSLDPNSKKFWEYSWHEIGVFDIPALIDYILSITKLEKLRYLGYSMGTTAAFVWLSELPEYNEKIIELWCLAPSVYLGNIRAPIQKAAADQYYVIKLAFEALEIYKFNVEHELLMRIGEIICGKAQLEGSAPLICKNLISLILSSDQINCTSLPDILEFAPSGISTKQLLHYLQLIRTGKFRQYDYDNWASNNIAYGQSTPPYYDLSRITVPFNIFYSKDDDVCIYENVERLILELKNVKHVYNVTIPNFNHVDFIYSKYVRILNDAVVETIEIGEN